MSAAPRRRRRRHPVGRFFAFLGVTLLCLVIILFGVVWVLERGPSPTVTAMFTRSLRLGTIEKFIREPSRSACTESCLPPDAPTISGTCAQRSMATPSISVIMSPGSMPACSNVSVPSSSI